MRRETARLRAASSGLGALTAKDEPEEAARDDRAELADAAGREGDQDEGEDGDRRARAIGREALGHAEHRLRDNGDRHQLEPMQQALACGPVKRARPIRDERHRDRRRQGEAGPGRQRAGIACAHEADGEPDLAARGPRQELAKRYQIAERPLVEPAAFQHERVAEVAQMRDRPAETGQAEFQEDAQDFERGPAVLA